MSKNNDTYHLGKAMEFSTLVPQSRLDVDRCGSYPTTWRIQSGSRQCLAGFFWDLGALRGGKFTIYKIGGRVSGRLCSLSGLRRPLLFSPHQSLLTQPNLF